MTSIIAWHFISHCLCFIYYSGIIHKLEPVRKKHKAKNKLNWKYITSTIFSSASYRDRQRHPCCSIIIQKIKSIVSIIRPTYNTIIQQCVLRDLRLDSQRGKYYFMNEASIEPTCNQRQVRRNSFLNRSQRRKGLSNLALVIIMTIRTFTHVSKLRSVYSWSRGSHMT